VLRPLESGAGPAGEGPSSPFPHLRQDWDSPLPTSAPGLASPLPHLQRDWARHCHICNGTGLTPAPHLRRDWARPWPHQTSGPCRCGGR
jgi:hypothetical protein